MRRSKYIIFTIAMCLYSLLYMNYTEGVFLINLYNGFPFGCNEIRYIIQFILFLSYSVFVYNEFETYIDQYGVLLVVRYQSRNRMVLQLFFRLSTYICILECIKLFCFVILSIILRGSIIINDPIVLYKTITLEILVYIIVFFVQVILEIFYSGKIALFIVLSYYLCCLGVSNSLFLNTIEVKKINLILLPNLTMRYRLDELTGGKHYIILLVGVFAVISFLFLLFRKLFSRKDILGY